MENYYIEKLNSNKYTGKLFGIIGIPSGTPFHLILGNAGLSSIIEIFIGTYFISVILAIAISYEMYRKNKLRIEILENCILGEVIMKEELEKYGVGEFIYDSSEVTDEDRKGIFIEALNTSGKQKTAMR
jgi:hypothetical protein